MPSFTKYPSNTYAQMEGQILEFWRQHKVFEQSISSRPKDKYYVFYDGPPFITGLPHHGTLLSSIIKDVIPRFQTMQGFRVYRRWGWDCHGLPAENFVEKKLGLKDKRAVLNYGLKEYITACQTNMIQTGSLWEESIERVGRWVEFKNAYKTMDKQYMESVWWAFKQLYDKGKIYEGEKVLMYCTRCATPVSKVEIAMDNSYKTVVDKSVYVKFALDENSQQKLIQKLAPKITIKENIKLLAWTTTPWTLLANTALAVNFKFDYVLIQYNQEFYVVAQDLLTSILEQSTTEYKVLKTFKGQDLVGLTYKPLFDFAGQNAHQILKADYVTLQEGSGIVHLAPAYGEEDYDLAQEFQIPIVSNIDENGLYQSGPFVGQNVWQTNDLIIEHLDKLGYLFRAVDYKHSYPHCHRCQTRLMYKAHPSWFLDIASIKQRMLQTNKQINWFPKHIKYGRFHDIVQTAPDWNISRDRLWATPLPVWRGFDQKTGEQKTIVVGSYKELEELCSQTLKDYHRPFVDELKFEKDGVLYQRVDKVLDCWFESGSMPFAQHYYPFLNQEFVMANFPADFIAEYVGQVRAWFYYLHAISVALFDKPSFLNVIVTGTILGSDGRKISKSLGNYTDPLQLINHFSADAYRLVLMNSSVLMGEDFSLTDKEVADKQRKLNTLRNVLEFFLLYATADGWQADLKQHLLPPPTNLNLFDRWLLSQLSCLNEAMTKAFKDYNLPQATRPLLIFIDDLSNWYIRRNRKRFWKTQNDNDKQAAYHTLYFTLIHLAHLMAPLCPFLAEDIYLRLTGLKQSIHLQLWPTFDFKDLDLIKQMQDIRHYITLGLSQRVEAGLRVRQPLASLTVLEKEENFSKILADLKEIILEELNVKELHFQKSQKVDVVLDTHLTPALKQEGWVREVVRCIQSLRKQAKLQVEDRITLNLVLDNQSLSQAFESFADYIKEQTLATRFEVGTDVSALEHQSNFNLNDVDILVCLQKS